MDTAAALEDMTQCPICLEKFTRPKMLPCQHSYCLSCLYSLVRNNTSVTCPTCREVHPLPPGGVEGLRDNLLIKNLLELKFQSMHTSGDCSDCRKSRVLSNCEHCNEPVCVDCRVGHNKMSWEIEISIRNLKEVQSSQEGRKEQWVESHGNICEQIDRMSQIFRNLEEKLLAREREVSKTMEFIERVHDVFTGHSTKPLLDDICNRLRSARDMKTLSELKMYVNSVRNAVDMMVSHDNAAFVLSAGGLEKLEASIDSLGEFSYGDSAVTMETLMSENAEFKGDKQQAKASGSRENHSQSNDNGTKIATPPVRCYLPSNINYANKSFCHVTVVNSNHEASKIVNPTAAVYNPDDGRIYIADSDTDRILQYDTKDRSLKPVFLSFEPNSLAVSNGHLYIAEKERKLRVGSFITGNTHWFREHHFKADYVCSYGHLLIILDSESQCGTSVHVVDSASEQILRTFRICANLVLGMAVSKTGDIYLSTQEKGHCTVQIYSMDGQFLKEFEANSVEMGDISRLCVDADGFVCISRPVSDRVDVYSSDGQFVSSFGTPGKAAGQMSAPSGLAWMPDGRLLVCDCDNNRVQIF